MKLKFSTISMSVIMTLSASSFSFSKPLVPTLRSTVINGLGFFAGLSMVTATTYGFCEKATITPNEDGTMNWVCDEYDWRDISGVKCFSGDTVVHLTDRTNADPPKGQMGYHPTDIKLTHLS